MTQGTAFSREIHRSLLPIVAALISVGMPTAFGQGKAPVQSATAHVAIAQTQWQVAAGGKMEFEVASVRQNSPGSPYRGDVDLDSSDYFRYTGGLVTATGLVVNYIIFAYKIDDASQYPLLNAQLPKWAQTEQFYIEARAAGHPTKDQIRLMVQSLLADRFKLTVHTESRQLPIYALVLDKPGVTGPQLQPHPGDALCTKMPDKPTPAVHGSVPAPMCGLIVWPNHGQMHMRMMDYTMQQIAGNLATTGARLGGLDVRPVLDQTGLSGRFDFDLEFSRVANVFQPSNADSQPEEPGPTFVQALKNQTGLRLVKQTGGVDVYVIDHVEVPSEN